MPSEEIACNPALPRSAPIIEVRDLRTHFDTDEGVIRAVDGVSFSVAQGETLAIVGESGSGKSVTGLSIMRLLARTPARIVGGEIRFHTRDGRALSLIDLDERSLQGLRGRDIAMIFQDPMSSLNPVFTIGEQIAESLREHLSMSRKVASSTAMDLLAQVGIPDPAQRLSNYPHELSGGMRQRVMIALALACEPRLLIADEPTTALDVTIQAQIITLLKQLQLKRRMAMIFVTHDLKLVEEMADRVAVMYASRVVEEGAVRDVIAHPRHPYTQALLKCIPRRDYAAAGTTALQPIPGNLPDPLKRTAGCLFHPRCRLAEEACKQINPPLVDVSAHHASACLRWQEVSV